MNLREYLRAMIAQECETLIGAVNADAGKDVISAIANRLNGFADQYKNA